MNIQLDRESRMPLYMQIKNQIKSMIFSGTLPPEYLLPPERKLAGELDVNRTTILNAYRELKAEGLVDSRVGKGTMVTPYDNRLMTSLVPPKHGLSWQYLVSDEAYRFNDSSIIEMLKINGNHPVISFATGMADPTLYPIEEFYQEASLDLQRRKNALGHAPVEGSIELREAIGRLQKEKGIDSKLEERLVLSGSQQGLSLIARCLLNVGDTVIVQEPTYIGALHILLSAGVKVIGIPVNEQGMRVDIMETLIKKHKPKLIYVIPTFQNPTGITMNLETRIKLLNIAYSNQVPIIEDDAYGDLKYDETSHLPTLKSLDQYGHVLYLNTFSKTLSPGIRIGWICGPIEIINRMAIKKQLEDLHTSSFSQAFLSDYLRKGLFHEHLQKTCEIYKEKRDCMIELLKKEKIEGLHWTEPAGGLYIWCRLPHNVSAEHLLLKAKEEGVIFVPGTAFYLNKQGNEYMRLNFTYPSIKEIQKGMSVLLKIIKDQSEKNFKKNMNDDSTIFNPMY